MCLVNVCRAGVKITQSKLSTLSNKAKPHRSSRMRSGWLKVFLLVLVLALALLYLSNIKTEVYSHSERLQRAHHNETLRGHTMLRRMDKMEENLNRLRESLSLTAPHLFCILCILCKVIYR